MSEVKAKKIVETVYQLIKAYSTDGGRDVEAHKKTLLALLMSD